MKSLSYALLTGAATGALIAAPTAVISTTAPTSATTPVVVANPDGEGSGDDRGGCSSGPNWDGCGGWNPVVGGFGSGCINGICGGWDGFRWWGDA